jgi:outer membrane protein assembly factor BamB
MRGKLGTLMYAAAAAVALTGCWPVPGQSADRDAYNEVEEGFDVDSVADFTERWSVTVDDVGPRGLGPAVVSIGGGVRVHVTSGRTVFTFEARTGSLLWESVPDASTPTIEELDTEAFVFGEFLTTSVRTSGTRWEAVQCGLTTGGCTTLGGEVPGRLEAIRELAPNRPVMLLSYFSGTSQSAQAYFESGPVVHLTDQPNDSRLTLGRTQMFHAGVGVGTAPANGVRAYPFAGGAGWTTPIDGTDATSPVLSADGATVYVGTDAGTVHALSTTDGAVRWSAPVGAAVTAPPALAEGRLHVPTAAGLVTLSTAGDPLWSSAEDEAITTQPAVAAGVVFTGTSGGVQAHDAAGCVAPATSCDAVWSDATGSAVTGAPTVANARLYVGTQDGRLVAYGLPPA